MNNFFRVEIKQSALDDIENVYDYMFHTFKSLSTAEKYYNIFLKAISELAYNAGIRQVYVERNGQQIFRKNVKNYAILYTKSFDLVTVISVFYERRFLTNL